MYVFQVFLGTFYFRDDDEFRFVIVFVLLLRVKLHSPVSKFSFLPAYDFHANVLSTLALYVREIAFLLTYDFDDVIRSRENARRG